MQSTVSLSKSGIRRIATLRTWCWIFASGRLPQAVAGAADVYNLAADMGGMGFIENNKGLCMVSVLINTHMLLASQQNDVQRFFYASSACVYAADKQTDADNPGLKESDAYPALPEDGYGWEKLFSEPMCRHFREDFGLHTRVARYQTFMALTARGGEDARRHRQRSVGRWRSEAHRKQRDRDLGRRRQTRSFMYIDDCIYGTKAILDSQITEPINLGSSEMVTINQLVDIVEDIAGLHLDVSTSSPPPRASAVGTVTIR